MVWPNPAPTPYCGPAPSPETLALHWNLDPILIGAFAALAVLYILGSARLARRGRGNAARERAAFLSGWLLAAAALVSPLCPLSVSLFAARIGQHVILALLVAPLVIAGRPIETLAAAFSAPAPQGKWVRPAPLSSAAVFAALLWFWHAPEPYDATFSSAFLYWTMHLSVFGSALWMWHGLFDARAASLMRRVSAGVISSGQMSFLGALITLAPRPIYAPHALTTVPWGLAPLQDQQLGGGIMWVPGCLVFLAISLLTLWPALTEPKLREAA